MTFEEIQAIAFGEIGLLPNDFYKMSWKEFFLTLRGYRKKQEDNNLMQAIFTREIAHQVYTTIPLKKGKTHLKKSKYWHLPIDDDKEEVETQRMRETMEKLTQQRNGTGN